MQTKLIFIKQVSQEFPGKSGVNRYVQDRNRKN